MSSGNRGSKTPFPSLAESTRITGRLSPIFSTASPQGTTLYSMANTLHISFLLEDHETDSSHEKDYPGEAAPSLPHLVVPLNNFQQLSADLLSLTSSITQSASKANGALTTDKNPTVPAPNPPTTSGATATQSTNPLDTTASTQAAKRQASFLKKASNARTHHAEDDFSQTLFRSVMGRDPNKKSD